MPPAASDQLQEILTLLEKGKASTAGRAVPLEEQRARYRKLAALMPAPAGVRSEAVDADGVAAEWHRPTRDDASDAALVYFHGGGYVIGGLDTHRKLAGHLAVAVGVPVLLVDYRLAPEHPHPAAVTDATAALRWARQGRDPARVAVGGDSAGGGLALATCLSLRDAGEELPAAAVLISPWTDLEGTGDTMTTRADVDPMVTPESLGELAAWFLAGADPRDPLASPLHADLTGMPPVLIHVGDHERLLADSTRLADRLEAAGGTVQCEVWPHMVHVWHYFAGWLPEADAALAAIAGWLRPRLGVEAAPG